MSTETFEIQVANGTATPTRLQRDFFIANDAALAVDTMLGSVQVFQRSGGVPPGGEPRLQGDAIPWHGAMPYTDGGFNAMKPSHKGSVY